MNMKKHKTTILLTMILGVFIITRCGSNNEDSGMFVALSNSSGKVAYSTDGINWSTGQPLPGATWRSVCYGKGMFVAVCTNGDMAYSTDGEIWQQYTWGVDNWWSVCYGNGKFVVVASGSSGKIAYSPNGKDWTEAIWSGTENWFSVCYGIGMFIVVDLSGKIAYSPNGKDWTEATLSGGIGTWQIVCYGKGKFIASANNYLIAYSNNVIDWTVKPISDRFNSICYGNGKFVAVPDSGNKVYHSADGISWSEAKNELPGYSSTWSVCYGDGKFIAVGGKDVGIDIAAYSYDGINWTTISMPDSVSGSWGSITYGLDEDVFGFL